ncbi:MAG: PASTA domain-containing protein [Lachnospiraceae bacterium]|nr:PASTA domain-containing protein [Lachnospiraceae bacterium]
MTVAGVVLAIIIVIIVFLLVSRLFGFGSGSSSDTDDTQTEESVEDEDSSTSANTVEMPNLLGMTVTEAKIELEELGLGITLKGSEASSEYASGQIMKQSVEAGSRVEVGSSVEVTTSSGEDSSATTSETEEEEETTVTVPSVLEKDEATARSALTAAGLTVGTVTESTSSSVEEGLVISQSVEANSIVEKGTTVNLVISSGPQKATVTDVIGHEQTRAVSELEADGFKVSVSEAYSDDIRSGLVISTDPDRGTSVSAGSTVTITVSLGKQKVTIPSVVVNKTFDA